jgi:zinc protease
MTDRSPLRARVRHVPGAPVVAVRVWSLAGSRVERVPGQALVAGRMLTEGTARRDWRAIAEAAEARGASVSSSGGLEVQGLAVDALAADWEIALEWAAELFLESAFPADRCEWLARQAAAELAALADHPDVVAGWRFLEQLYSPHPRSRPLQGSPEHLAALTPDDCRDLHERARTAGILISVAGRIDEAAVAERVAQLFPAAPGASPPPAPPAPQGLAERRLEVPLSDGDQAHLFVGQLTAPRTDPDVAELEVLGIVLGAGAGLSGRIPTRLREREGLAYVARAETLASAGLDPGHLSIYVGTSPATVDASLRAVREELEKIVEAGVTEAEVEEARSYLLGREPFRRETARQWAELMALADLYGLPFDSESWVRERLSSVDRSGVERVARRWIDPQTLAVTVGLPGPADGV